MISESAFHESISLEEDSNRISTEEKIRLLENILHGHSDATKGLEEKVAVIQEELGKLNALFFGERESSPRE